MRRRLAPAVAPSALVAAAALLAAIACGGAGTPAPVGTVTQAPPVPVATPAAPPPVVPPTDAAPAAPAAPPSPATDAPAGTAIVRDHCLTCHSEEMLQQQRLTAAQWKKTIVKMQGWGSTLPQARAEGLAEFLARQYGKDAGPFVPATLAAHEAAAMFQPRPAAAYAGGDRARGLALYSDRCEACHAEGGGGGEAGIDIVGRRILDRPADLAGLVRAGRGDMPSFDDTTDAEIADLVAYLRSLSPIATDSAAQ